MTLVAAPSAAVAPWTCPFCPLLCDDLAVAAAGPAGTLGLSGGECPRAQAALSRFTAEPSSASPSIDGRPCDLDAAVAAAARILAGSRQPLFGGLGTDVAGARALYRLACETGAICDAARGSELMQGQRTLQDHGGFLTTLAEVRTRADLVVLVGGLPARHAPRLLQRCGVGDAEGPERQVVLLGGKAGDEAELAGLARVAVKTVAPGADLFRTVAQLGALVGGRVVRDAGPGLADLAGRLHGASYAVFVGAVADLPAEGALIMEGLHRCVGELNLRSRAAVLWVGGGDGAATVNQTFAWLSGLPLRSRTGPAGIEHDPLRFDAVRLLDDGAVDALLWVSSFGPESPPPSTAVPRIVLGHPAAAPAGRDGTVFIPVSTPGIGTPGHLFRTDGSVVLPLLPVYTDGLPSVAEVVGRLTSAVVAARAGQAA
ncbi:formylmethanofuran dehydrogenase [Ideonella sp. YS5]|uniref:formylmethanofuran dehydrogenase n=1 Tax=Ideonella sp. YS5 TaxID=3453714 RepID=UPI003EEA6C6C